jgi:uncharacterized protein YqgV (UPF0045/DUF77 family)
MILSAQLSLYPLGETALSLGVAGFCGVLENAGLSPVVGAMSTVVTGDSDVVFPTLQTAFERAAAAGHVVLIATISNACPV